MVSVLHELQVLQAQRVLHALQVQRVLHDGVRGPQKEFRHLNRLNQVDRVEKVLVLAVLDELQIVPSIHHMDELDV
jgi:hypothetical protein